jgi:hypothetical protein
VLIQTEYPDHPLYRALIDHDYARFAAKPAGRTAHRRLSRPSASRPCCAPKRATMAQALAFLAAARAAAEPLADGVTLYDPVPMRLQRLMTLERGQLLVESLSRPALQAFLRQMDGAALRAEDARRPALASRRRSAGVLVFPEKPEPARHLQRQQPAESDLVGGAHGVTAGLQGIDRRRSPTG